ncbi:lysophospholipid acyltransferase family protein [Saccharicrinis sp. FJH54]|uniref:lysophospholipid acyltransferase family protein n=1 Tax=Saccharicrinis sp. FJH54 TaxID=3344665 RepID=UPI0035D471F8
MGRLVYILLKIFAKLTSFIPFALFYAFADVIYVFLYYGFKYRRNIVRSNLAASFPEKTDEERLRIEKRFYHHLADIFVESFKAFGMNPAAITQRHHLIHSESFSTYESTNQSILVVTGHYGNWEWGALSAPLQAGFKFVAINKRIKNPHIDVFIHKNRSRYGTVLDQIKNTSDIFQHYCDKHAAFILVADQSPGIKHMDQAYWINFLNQETPCLHGPEKYARKYNLPVIYLEIMKIKRGYYELRTEELVSDPSTLEDGEITRRYMNRLEKTIREKPEYWLWSHRRWKRKRSDGL